MGNIILIGFKGSGKTYFGRRLADRVGRKYIDIDNVIEKIYFDENKTNLPCKKIYEKHGKQVFRSFEHKAVLSLETTQHAIISLGGGTILAEENVAVLKRLGTLIFLKASKETLKKRILTPPYPAFINKKNPKQSFEQMYKERKSKYEEASDIKVSIDGKTDHQVLEKLEEIIKKSNEE